MAKDQKDPREAAMDHVALRERTEGELRQYLKEKGYDDTEVEDTMAFAVDCCLVDDREYCRRFVEYSIRKGRGPLRIMRDLTMKGVDRVLVREALEEGLDEETERGIACAIVEKELPEEPEERDLARVARKLASRGFRNSVITYVMNRSRWDR